MKLAGCVQLVSDGMAGGRQAGKRRKMQDIMVASTVDHNWLSAHVCESKPIGVQPLDCNPNPEV